VSGVHEKNEGVSRSLLVSVGGKGVLRGDTRTDSDGRVRIQLEFVDRGYGSKVR
jgi:hypothetical protein